LWGEGGADVVAGHGYMPPIMGSLSIPRSLYESFIFFDA
jgi:hypothetical protein